MENQDLINISLGLLTTILGWVGRELWEAVKELKNDLTKLREDLPKDYVSRTDFRDDINEIKSMLQRVFDRLENKVDRDYR